MTRNHHLANLIKYRDQPDRPDLSAPQSLQLYLRFDQLIIAAEFELWQVGNFHFSLHIQGVCFTFSLELEHEKEQNLMMANLICSNLENKTNSRTTIFYFPSFSFPVVYRYLFSKSYYLLLFMFCLYSALKVFTSC
ncbi:unnamed protein product [Trifolium pratense]|uniref:Uncharacterized protein n=1 Tax=Trifolium pratense TaxID=57577 RepID=A0ACB0JBY2_TRIPR|nr:unnamed protein product [Trifolium pratense]